MPAPSADLFLGRQPILDQNRQMVGYELLFRTGPENRAQVACRSQATADVVCAAFAELGIADALGTRWGLINVDAGFLCSDAIGLLPKDHVVLELSADELSAPATAARCRELRQEGYRLALSGLTEITDTIRPALGLVDIIKLDVGILDDGRLKALAGQLGRLPAKLLAGRVETEEEMARCQALGFRLFQGYYFAHPAVLQGRKLDPALGGLVKIIDMLTSDADAGQIESAFKHQPALTINLLRLTNSVGVGLAVRVTSVRHAIAILGRRQLLRWLQLLLIAGRSDQADVNTNPLMQLAALRGRFIELLAERRYAGNRGLADMGFITGILSVMPAALGMPMVDILAQVAVAPEVRRALARQEGELGLLLRLMEDYDDNDVAACAADLDELGGGLGQPVLNATLTEALAWVQQLGTDSP